MFSAYNNKLIHAITDILCYWLYAMLHLSFMELIDSLFSLWWEMFNLIKWLEYYFHTAGVINSSQIVGRTY